VIEVQELAMGSMALGAAAVFFLFSRKNKPSMEQKVINCIADACDLHPRRISRGTLISNIVLDSEDEMELLLSLEDEFSIVIPDDVLDKFATVNDIIVYVETQVERSEHRYE